MDTQHTATEGAVLLQWEATARPHIVRSPRWYTIAAVIMLAGVAYGIVTGAWSLSIVLLMCGAVYFLQRDHVPQSKRIVLREDGVEFDGQQFAWSECKDFWIITSPLGSTLFVARTARRKPPLSIQTLDIPLPAIRTTLSRFLPEQADREESLIDTISRICKL